MIKNHEYLNRVNKVIDYINRNLDSDLSLNALAQIAAFSPFHFHRIFKAAVGENVNDFVNRLRVERAAVLLQYQPANSVTDIAIQCGFSSAAAFSRSFKNFYRISPSEFRKNGAISKICKVDGKNRKEIHSQTPYDRNREANDRFKVTVRELPGYTAAYSRILHGFNKGVYSRDITKAFDNAYQWAEARGLLTNRSKAVGILYDNLDITSPDKCRYDAGVTIDEQPSASPGAIGIQEVTAGKYACIRLEQDNLSPTSFLEAINELGAAVDYLYGEWLLNSAYQLEDKPCLEFYHTSRFDPTIIIEFCLPVIPL